MDLTEHAGAKINRLGEACLKNNLITASNGSLVSTGEVTVVFLNDKQNKYLCYDHTALARVFRTFLLQVLETLR